ncbi:MAG: HD-GYP domain-containing protein [Clostridia bacterium]|nr:HD-GYP domain-containing protein [Clostridia bacterium]
MEKLNKDNAYLESIETLLYAVEAKDSYTRGHSDRVSEYSVLIGKYLSLSEEELNILRIGGIFHDIGKIGISDQILKKKGKLTDEEYLEIKNHPNIGKNILSNSTIFKDIIPIVLHHHERFDGTGYPSNLKGEEIPYLARITSIADSFDAMTSNRPYRTVLSLEQARSEIEKNSGTQFDPKIVKVFLEVLDYHYDEIQEIQKKY